MENRIALQGILFVLKIGLPWEDLPLEMGCSGMALQRCLRDWQHAGVWDQFHALLMKQLRAVKQNKSIYHSCPGLERSNRRGLSGCDSVGVSSHS